MSIFASGTDALAAGIPDVLASNLVQRILSALILGPLVIWAAWVGGIPLMILVALAGIGGFYEWSRVIGAPVGLRVAISAVVLVAVPLWFAAVDAALWAGVVSVLLITLLVGAWGAIAYTGGGLWDAVGTGVLGFTVFSLVSMDHIAGQPLIWVFAIVWATDTGAYAVGRTFGGPKLAPVISPNKTWSGALGGLAAGTIVGVVAGPYLGVDLPQTGLIAIAAILSVTSITGDLLQSAWKRSFDVKDSGAILPGHGGILDRIDGLIPASILASIILR